jgi:hypothetical protein
MLIISINSISCYLFIQFIFQYFILWTLWTPEFRTTMLFYIHIPGSSWFHISEGWKWAVGSTSRKRRCCQVFALRWWLPGGHVFSVPSLPSLGKAWRKVSGWCFSLFCLSGMEHSVPMVAHIYIYIILWFCMYLCNKWNHLIFGVFIGARDIGSLYINNIYIYINIISILYVFHSWYFSFFYMFSGRLWFPFQLINSCVCHRPMGHPPGTSLSAEVA